MHSYFYFAPLSKGIYDGITSLDVGKGVWRGQCFVEATQKLQSDAWSIPPNSPQDYISIGKDS